VTDVRNVDSTMPAEVLIAGIYESFAPELKRFATARVRDAATAEDFVHEAFARLAVETQARRTPINTQAWLRRVVLNLIISRARRAGVARRHAEGLTLGAIVVESPEVQFLAVERKRVLGEALDSVSSEGRTSVVLASQGYTGREIAALLGRTEGATRTLMCRTRREIRLVLTSRDSSFAHP